MTQARTVRVAIIGSGPAGWTAAIYAARASLNPVVIAGLQPGGQLTITTDVENYPGFADVIQGPWLMEQMEAQARHVGTEIISDIVLEADLSQRPFRIRTDSGQDWLAETVIIATGAQAKWLGLDSEARFFLNLQGDPGSIVYERELDFRGDRAWFRGQRPLFISAPGHKKLHRVQCRLGMLPGGPSSAKARAARAPAYSRALARWRRPSAAVPTRVTAAASSVRARAWR
jgi:hypothetical protein